MQAQEKERDERRIAMSRNKYTRLIAGLLVASLCMTMAGCSENGKTHVETSKATIESMEPEKSNAISFSLIGGKDVMPIAGYYSSMSSIYSIDGNSMVDDLTDEYYQMIADCGVNLITSPQIDYHTAPSTVMKMLDLGEKYGIATCVKDSTLTGIDGKVNSDLTLEEASARISEYSRHPAFAGVFLYDEARSPYYVPSDGTHDLSVYADMSKVLVEDLDVWCYMNSLGWVRPNDFAMFEKYMEEYCSTQSLKNISATHYPFKDTGILEGDHYLLTKMTYLYYSLKYDVPWWSFIQAGGQWNDTQNYFYSIDLYPNESQFNWNVHTSLAFGATGIHYFPLSQPYFFAYETEETFDFERNGLIGAWGNKNQWYYYAQNVNKHIAVIDEVLMNSVCKGIMVTGKTSKSDMQKANETRDISEYGLLIEGNAWRELADVSGDAVIGCFNYQGKTALYVANYSYEYAQKIDLTFVSDCKVKMVQNANTSYVEGKGITLDMPAGDGVLLVFE